MIKFFIIFLIIFIILKFILGSTTIETLRIMANLLLNIITILLLYCLQNETLLIFLTNSWFVLLILFIFIFIILNK